MAVHPAPDPAPADRFAGLPETWSESARETFAQIEEEHPNLDAASAATLYEACALLSLADEMEARVDADGLMIEGSSGQPVPHGLLSEIRLCRVQAMAALRPLGIAPAQSGASRAGAALVAKRWHGRTPGVRSGGAR